MTKEQELKSRITAVLKDLNDAGVKDSEAMWVLGSIASPIIDKAKADSWHEMRKVITASDYDLLLKTFQAKGNQFLAENNRKAAYAVQALGLSVAATSQTDPDIRRGAVLLDTIIDSAARFFRENKPRTN